MTTVQFIERILTADMLRDLINPEHPFNPRKLRISLAFLRSLMAPDEKGNPLGYQPHFDAATDRYDFPILLQRGGKWEALRGNGRCGALKSCFSADKVEGIKAADRLTVAAMVQRGDIRCYVVADPLGVVIDVPDDNTFPQWRLAHVELDETLGLVVLDQDGTKELRDFNSNWPLYRAKRKQGLSHVGACSAIGIAKHGGLADLYSLPESEQQRFFDAQVKGHSVKFSKLREVATKVREHQAALPNDPGIGPEAKAVWEPSLVSIETPTARPMTPGNMETLRREYLARVSEYSSDGGKLAQFAADLVALLRGIDPSDGKTPLDLKTTGALRDSIMSRIPLPPTTGKDQPSVEDSTLKSTEPAPKPATTHPIVRKTAKV